MSIGSSPFKIGPSRSRKNRRKDPHEDRKRRGKLTKHGVEMTCSICKSNSHNKRTCQERDKHQTSEHPSKKPRGRPPKNPLPSEVTSAGTIATNTEYHSRTAEPSRRRNSSGRGRGSWRNTTPRKNV